jgi:hypothetical protein
MCETDPPYGLGQVRPWGMCILAKVGVEGSNPFARSNWFLPKYSPPRLTRFGSPCLADISATRLIFATGTKAKFVLRERHVLRSLRLARTTPKPQSPAKSLCCSGPIGLGLVFRSLPLTAPGREIASPKPVLAGGERFPVPRAISS